jgi:hypothetical protein
MNEGMSAIGPKPTGPSAPHTSKGDMACRGSPLSRSHYWEQSREYALPVPNEITAHQRSPRSRSARANFPAGLREAKPGVGMILARGLETTAALVRVLFGRRLAHGLYRERAVDGRLIYANT